MILNLFYRRYCAGTRMVVELEVEVEVGDQLLV
jgi:hypothetical protein